jgi:PRTRC genetic system protein C
MARIFVYDGREFPDPDSKLSVEDVRKQLAEFFPELANAETREEKRGEDTVYTFTKRIGTKGQRGQPDVVTILRRVPEKRLRIFELAAELLDERGCAARFWRVDGMTERA